MRKKDCHVVGTYKMEGTVKKKQKTFHLFKQTLASADRFPK